MPIGLIINSSSIVLGGLFGVLLGRYIPIRVQNEMKLAFGLSAIAIGIMSIMGIQNMPVVIFSIILGTAIGVSIGLGNLIQKGAVALESIISKFVKRPVGLSEEEYTNTLVIIIVLFCASSTGIYGALVEGMNGDATILISKSILDFFTAAIFASEMGIIVSSIAIPQFVVLGSLFALSNFIMPLISNPMIADFKACGGLLVIATGLKMIKIKDFPIADMLVSLILVLPISWIWITYILPIIV